MRKLAIAAFSFSGAVFAAYYIVPERYIIIAAVVMALLSIISFKFSGDTKTRIMLIFVSAAVGLGASYLCNETKLQPTREISGQKELISATVKEYPLIKEEYSSVLVRLTEENVPRLDAVLYSSDYSLEGLEPGDRILAKVSLKSSETRYGEPYNGHMAENVYLLCYLDGEPVREEKSSYSILYLPQTISRSIANVSSKIFSDDTFAFMTALLTGNKSALYEDSKQYSDMSESGILHVVAISGMHLAFLVGFIMTIVRKKRAAAIISLCALWLFVPIAGASPSVLRAAFMQSSVLLAPILKRESDPITSLSAVFALLLFINPAACASVSLQLSFSAMLGIVLITPKIYKSLYTRFIEKSRNKKNGVGLLRRVINSLLVAVFAAFSSSVGAVVFTTPLSVLYFGFVPIYGIIVNILIFWAVTLSFILGYISCIIGLIYQPLGVLLGFVTSIPASFILTVSKLCAKLPYAAVYMTNKLFLAWLILVYIIIVSSLLSKRDKKHFPVMPVCVSVCALCVVILITGYRAETSPAQLTVADVGQGQSIILTSGGATAVIDCGGGGKIQNAGDTVSGLLLGSGRRNIELLALTHFDEDHVNGAIRLMSKIPTNYLFVPPDDGESPSRQKILEFAEKQGVQVYIISQDVDVSLGQLKIKAFAPISKAEPTLIFMSSYEDFDVLITGDANEEMERRFVMTRCLPDFELFIAGHHGSKSSNSAELLEAIKAETAVVSCGYNNYGHPTKEALKRLAKYSSKILRTDESGNITISMNG